MMPPRPLPGREIDAEIEFHFTETIEALVAQGWPPVGARLEAERRFGDRRRYRHTLARIDRADIRRKGRRMILGTLWHSFRHAARGLGRSPGVTVAVVLMLALGIGANATMFDIVDRLLLRAPDHVVDAERLRLVYADRPTLTQAAYARSLTYPDIDDLRTLPALESVSAFTPPRLMTLGVGTEARRIRVQFAEASFFPALGVRPAAGRFYRADEDRPGATPTIVLGESFWRAELGGEPGIVGQVMEVGTAKYEVIGIAPAGFTGADLRPTDAWVPLRTATSLESGPSAFESRTWWWASTLIRLRPGVTDEAVNAQMTGAHVAARREVERRGGEAYLSRGPARLYSVSLVTARRPDPSQTASVSLWLAGVSAIVLLIACANVANLLLTRGIQMRHELALRAALGAARGRLMMLVLAEAMLLATAGALAAFVVARWTGALAQAFLPDIDFGPSGAGLRLLLFNLGAAALTVLAAGLLPAWQASRASAAEAMDAASRGGSSRRSPLRSALMVAQTALSVVLLVGAGLFVRSLYNAVHADVGFDAPHVLVARIEGQPGLDAARRDALFGDALKRVSAIPGVQRAALSMEATIAFGGHSGPGGISTPGGGVIDDLPDGGPFLYMGSEGFFETLGVPVVRGRSFRAEDYVKGAELVGMVSETFARTVWPDRDAIGQCFTMGAQYAGRIPPQPCQRVVGVFRDFARAGLADEGAMSVAVAQRTIPRSPQALVARVTGHPDAAASAIRQTIAGLSRDVRFVQVELMSERVDELLEPWKLGATMFLVFGGLALIVAAVGLYSLLAFGVAQRRRELAIRTVLGAQRSDLLAQVMRQAAVFLAVGLVTGGVAALAAGRFVEHLLFDVRAVDPMVFALVAVTLGIAGGLAALVPAVRAMRVSPATALKEQ
jgi:putative ABC transport system permease protein